MYYFLLLVVFVFCNALGCFLGWQVISIFEFENSNFRYIFQGVNFGINISLFRYIDKKYLVRFKVKE